MIADRCIRLAGRRSAPAQSMEIDDDPAARVRERRFNVLVTDLLLRVRRRNLTLPNDQVLEMAESMTELRLSDKGDALERGHSGLR